MKVAIIGGGWAGLAAAVSATQQQHDVTLYEMAPEFGGRARSFQLPNGLVLDNGQHILIGAYTQTLKLLETVGVDIEQAFYRTPFSLQYPDGSGIILPKGKSSAWAFLRGLWTAKGWSLVDKYSLLRAALTWHAHRFKCNPDLTVSELCRNISPSIYHDLIVPICISALNTPAKTASAQIFLRVIQDGLMGQAMGSDMLIPRVPLKELLPDAGQLWLEHRGARLHKSTFITDIQSSDQGQWIVNQIPYDAVIIATSQHHAKKLTQGLKCHTSSNKTYNEEYESIITTYLQSFGTRLPHPVLALRSHPQEPGQFLFDLGALGHHLNGIFAVVTSCSKSYFPDTNWVQHESDIIKQSLRLKEVKWVEKPILIKSIQEKRATSLSTPKRMTPQNVVERNLILAGDYTIPHYPSTLESAVLSGQIAIESIK